MSLKNTYNAESTNPTPTFNIIRHMIGYNKVKNFQLNGTPSSAANRKNTTSVIAKLIMLETFLLNRNKYLGIFTFVKICALLIRAFIPPVVDSLKKLNIKFPANKYVV